MKMFHPAVRRALVACLVLAPLLQLIGDSLWLSHRFPYAWSLWREASYPFFIPVGFLLASQLATKRPTWAVIACAVFVVGCFGVAAMMPLFRLGAFYPVEGHYEFPTVVQSVMGKGSFAATLFLPGLCFPVSFLVFGIGFWKVRVFPTALSLAYLVTGILFWFGNAGEMEALMLISDAWLLVVFCWTGYCIFRKGAPTAKTERVLRSRLAEREMAG